jgi:hypothetical protein
MIKLADYLLENKNNKKVLKEAEDRVTVGAIKAALSYMKGKSADEAKQAIAKKTVNVATQIGLKAILSMIPGGSFLPDALEQGMNLKDIYSAGKESVTPADKKKNPFWDIMTIDPRTLAIVDDKVEFEFLRDFESAIEGRPDSEPLPDIDIVLNNYLKKKYEKNINVAR